MKAVTIVGVGALGSWLLHFSRFLPVRFHVIDGDKVEVKNTLAQAHGRPAVGQNKALAIRAAARQLYGLDILATPHMLRPENLSLLDLADVAVDATDNAAARNLLAAWARDKGRPCMHLAIAADGAYGRVAWSGVAGHPPFVADVADPGAPTCEKGDFLPELVLVAAAGARALALGLDGKFSAFSASPGRLSKI